MRNDSLRNEGQDRLIPLSDLKDFKVAKEDPDARGWKVIGADGERFGKVKDLIVDPHQMKARYLDVEVDRRLFNEEYDRHLLVPIGAATLDREDDKVFVPFIDRTSVVNYPVYHGGTISEDYEYAVREAILGPEDRNRSGSGTNTSDSSMGATTPRSTSSQPISDEFYEHDHFNETKFYSNRQDEEADRSHFVRDQDRVRDIDSDRDRDSGGSIFDDRDHFRDQRSSSSSSLSSASATPESRKDVEESISTIERLEQLRERGSITEEEFRTLKKRALDL
jgi:photosynthetic reaction center H subunit